MITKQGIKGVLLINNPVSKKFESWVNLAVLLEYSIIVFPGYTVNKDENGSGETRTRWLTNLYTSIRSPLCLRQYKKCKLRCCNLALYDK